MKKSLTITFWALVGFFLFILSEFFIPVIRNLFKGSELFLLPFIIFSFLGVVLIFLTLKKRIKGVLRKFLLLTGASAVGFFIFVFLHNAFYALSIITGHIVLLNYLTEVLHVAFFLIAIFVCPLGFLIGMVGVMVIAIKKRNGF
ncbi:MAG: hypothetical protein ACKKMW_03450 [Candidatus Nealsonbacteria bacterium]